MEPNPRPVLYLWDIEALRVRVTELEAAVRDHKDMNGTMTADQILWDLLEEDASV